MTKENEFEILKASLKERLELLLNENSRLLENMNIRYDILNVFDKSDIDNNLLFVFEKFINDVNFFIDRVRDLSGYEYNEKLKEQITYRDLVELVYSEFLYEICSMPQLLFSRGYRFLKLPSCLLNEFCSNDMFEENFKPEIKGKKNKIGVYRIYNMNKDIIYVGKSNKDLYKRLPESILEQFNKGDEIPFYYDCAELKTECDVDIYELYYINTIKPVNNTVSKYNNMPRVKLPELKFTKLRRIPYISKNSTYEFNMYVEMAKEEKESKKDGVTNE